MYALFLIFFVKRGFFFPLGNRDKPYFTGAQVQDSFCHPHCLLHKDSTGITDLHRTRRKLSPARSMTCPGRCIGSLSRQLSPSGPLLLAGSPLSCHSHWADSGPSNSRLARKPWGIFPPASASCWCSQRAHQPRRPVPLLIREIHLTHTLGKMSWDGAKARWALSLWKAWQSPENICKCVWVFFIYVCVYVCVCPSGPRLSLQLFYNILYSLPLCEVGTLCLTPFNAGLLFSFSSFPPARCSSSTITMSCIQMSQKLQRAQMDWW